MRVGPLASVLALAMIVSGCFGSGDNGDNDGSGNPSPPADPVLRIHDGTTLLDDASVRALGPAASSLLAFNTSWRSVAGYDAREPTVGVDSTGAVYYAARDYSGGNLPPVSATQTPIMKSTDGGLTWEDVSPRLPTGDREPPRSGDPMVFVDPWTDRIFQIELYDLACNWLVYSDDQGATWTGNPKACSSLIVDHQTIGSGPSHLGLLLPVYENVVYVCVNQIADSHCSRSLDGGLTFGTFHLVYPGACPQGDGGAPGVAGGIHGHVLVDPDGFVYLPRDYCGRPYVAVSDDDGTTWTLVDVSDGIGASDQDPNMAFDDTGRLYFYFIGDDELGYVTTSTDHGTTWTSPVRVTPPEITAANHPSITAGSEGRIGFVFTGTKDPLPEGEDADWNNVTWNSYMGVGLNVHTESPVFAVRNANPPGEIVYRGDCTHQRCGYIREFYDASVAPDGRFYGAFVDACVRPDEPRAKNDVDCNTVPDDYGEGNGHLGYVGVTIAGPSLWVSRPDLAG